MLHFEQRSRYHTKTTDEHVFDAVQAAANMGDHANLRTRMALLFHDSGKPKTAWIDNEGVQHYYALSPEKAVRLNTPVTSLEDHEFWGAEQATKALKRLNAPSQFQERMLSL